MLLSFTYLSFFFGSRGAKNASAGDQDLGGHDPGQAAHGDWRKGALHEGA